MSPELNNVLHDVIFELREPLHRFIRKNSHRWQHISVAQDGFQNFMCDIYSLFNELSLSLQGSMTTIFKSVDKVAANPVWNYGDSEQMLGCCQLSKEFEHYFPTTRPPQSNQNEIME